MLEALLELIGEFLLEPVFGGIAYLLAKIATELLELLQKLASAL